MLTRKRRNPVLISHTRQSTTAKHTALSLADAKDFLEIGHTDDDAQISAHIKAARDIFRRHTGHYLDDQVRRAEWDQAASRMNLPAMPVRSVTAVETLYQGSATSMDPANFFLHGSQPPDLRAKSAVSFPSPRDTFAAEFDAGYASASDVPDGIEEVLRRMVADMFENRVSQSSETGTADELPMSWKRMMTPYKIVTL